MVITNTPITHHSLSTLSLFLIFYLPTLGFQYPNVGHQSLALVHQLRRINRMIRMITIQKRATAQTRHCTAQQKYTRRLAFHRQCKLRQLFISLFNQLDAQNLFHNKFYFVPLHVSSTCAHHQEVKIVLHSLWYHHTCRCDDTRGCVMQF